MLQQLIAAAVLACLVSLPSDVSANHSAASAPASARHDSLDLAWEDGVMYEGRPHVKITTPRATYYYDKAGGGFSRIIDVDGNDWVAWHPEPTEYPASGAGMSRGLPNYQDGPGHPGYDACTSTVTEEAAESITIRSVCRDDSWEFTWTFYREYAKNHIVSTPENIWFLYEGPIAGRYAPREQYRGTSTDGWTESTPNYVAGERENGPWRWVYFGDRRVDRVFFLAMEEQYTDHAVFGYMGAGGSRDNPEPALRAENGMIVFGFGRESWPDKYISGGDKTFYIGFIEQKVTNEADHETVVRQVEQRITK